MFFSLLPCQYYETECVFRLETILVEEKDKGTATTYQIEEYHQNTVSILEQDLQEAKKLEEDAVQVNLNNS